MWHNWEKKIAAAVHLQLWPRPCLVARAGFTSSLIRSSCSSSSSSFSSWSWSCSSLALLLVQVFSCSKMLANMSFSWYEFYLHLRGILSIKEAATLLTSPLLSFRLHVGHLPFTCPLHLLQTTWPPGRMGMGTILGTMRHTEHSSHPHILWDLGWLLDIFQFLSSSSLAGDFSCAVVAVVAQMSSTIFSGLFNLV